MTNLMDVSQDRILESIYEYQLDRMMEYQYIDKADRFFDDDFDDEYAGDGEQ